MILAIDIGNTNIVIGCLDEQRTYFIDRLSTNRDKTEAEYALDLKTVLALHQVQPEEIEGSIISSVVPQITDSSRQAVKMVIKKEPLILEPGLKTGLPILTDQPGQVGRDRVADAVGALASYPPPLILIDLGTATTISVINAQGQFIGGLILPGIRVSLDALTARTSLLSDISVDAPRQVIGRNTIDSMKSGILYGNAAALDGIIDRIEAELGQKTTRVATGGWSGRIIPYCKREILREEDLLLKGLLAIYRKNSVRLRRQPGSVCPAPSNYDRQARQAQQLFLTFDQAAILGDFGLRSDEEFIYVTFVCQEYAIRRATGEIHLPGSGRKAGFHEVLSIFDMLCKGQGRPVLSGSWESLSRLGGFIGTGHSNSSLLDPYRAAFTGKTRELAQACRSLGGSPMRTGDVSFLLPVFDFFPVWFQFWDADEEEPASLRFLWDQQTLRYLHYETLWYIMMHILDQLLKGIPADGYTDPVPLSESDPAGRRSGSLWSHSADNR